MVLRQQGWVRGGSPFALREHVKSELGRSGPGDLEAGVAVTRQYWEEWCADYSTFATQRIDWSPIPTSFAVESAKETTTCPVSLLLFTYFLPFPTFCLSLLFAFKTYLAGKGMCITQFFGHSWLAAPL